MMMEEEIWDYIDGNCPADQIPVIEAKIASDPLYTELYAELIAIHQQMEGIELDEPSMSFTRNVMEKVDLEIAPVTLKTKVDTRIIYSILSLLGLAILSIFVYSLSKSNLTLPKFNFELTSSQADHLDFNKYMTPTFIKVFLFADLILALIYLDSFIRRKRTS